MLGAEWIGKSLTRMIRRRGSLGTQVGRCGKPAVMFSCGHENGVVGPLSPDSQPMRMHVSCFPPHASPTCRMACCSHQAVALDKSGVHALQGITFPGIEMSSTSCEWPMRPLADEDFGCRRIQPRVASFSVKREHSKTGL